MEYESRLHRSGRVTAWFLAAILFSNTALAAHCEQRLREAVPLARENVLRDLGISGVSDPIVEHALGVARTQARDIVSDWETFERDHQPSSLVAFGKKIRAFSSVLWSTFRSETRARDDLESKIKAKALELADATMHGALPPDLDQQLERWIAADLTQVSGREDVTLGMLARKAGKHLGNVFRSLGLGEIRRRRDVRDDLAKNLGILLSLQTMGQVIHNSARVLAGQASDWTSALWIYANTTAMVTVQSDVGARNTVDNSAVENRKLESLTSFGARMRELPAMLHGHSGYKTEILERLYGFVALLPFEYGVSLVFKMINVYYQHGLDFAYFATEWPAALKVNAAFTVVFGLYLATRWAIFDKWINLNYFPRLRTDARNATELRRARVQEAFWRYGVGAVDAIIVFGLVGSALPGLLGIETGSAAGE